MNKLIGSKPLSFLYNYHTQNHHSLHLSIHLSANDSKEPCVHSSSAEPHSHLFHKLSTNLLERYQDWFLLSFHLWHIVCCLPTLLLRVPPLNIKDLVFPQPSLLAYHPFLGFCLCISSTTMFVSSCISSTFAPSIPHLN